MPYQIGQPCDAAIVHTDHPQYEVITPADLPGARAFMDGRAVTDRGHWTGIPRRVPGIGPS